MSHLYHEHDVHLPACLFVTLAYCDHRVQGCCIFDTTRKGNHYSFLTLVGDAPFRLKYEK